MNWIEVTIKAKGEYEDLITDKLYKFGSIGVTIDNPQGRMDYIEKNQNAWDFIDVELKNIKEDKSIIKSYFENHEDINIDIDMLKQEIQSILSEKTSLDSVEFLIKEVDPEDWEENWKDYFQTLKIGDKIIIKPTWEEVDVKEDDITINLDPGMAFGTGSHETTYMCTEELEKYVKAGDSVYDIGCGSGILAIVAAKLGAKEVLAIDLDPMCVKTSKENIILNNVSEIVEVKEGNLLDIVEGKANIIVANIVAEAIVSMTENIGDYLVDGGIIITSGIILDKIAMVKNALVNKDFNIIEIKTMDDWACIVASK